jgi:isopenicillin N synthase-like dioxygenase
MNGLRHQSTDVFPVIDVGPLLDGAADPEARIAAAREIGQACRAGGLFYIHNHGIPEARRRAALQTARRFFALDPGRKAKLGIPPAGQFRGYVRLGGEVTQGQRDWHECIDLQPLFRDGRPADVVGEDRLRCGHPLDDPGQWPDGFPDFREVMMRAWDDMWNLSEALVDGIALSLGLPSGHFTPHTGVGLCSLRLAHYPPLVEGDGDDVDAGMGAHCDNGFLTILCQDDVDGLEVRLPDGSWVPAPHRDGAYLVNVGLMTQRWTNDLYKAAWHRVTLPKHNHRYSIPFFFEPKHDAVVVPLDICCSDENEPRYEPCVFGEYLNSTFAKAYRSDQPGL